MCKMKVWVKIVAIDPGPVPVVVVVSLGLVLDWNVVAGFENAS